MYRDRYLGGTVSLGDMVFRIAAGKGTVARFGDSVIVILDGPDEERVDDMLGHFKSAVSGGPSPRPLALSLIPLLSDVDPDGVSGYGLVTTTAHGVLVILTGQAEARVTSGQERSVWSGATAVTWFEKLIDPDFEELFLGAAGTSLEADVRGDLVTGVVSGAGVVISPRVSRRSSKLPEPEAPVSMPVLIEDDIGHDLVERPAPASEPLVEATPIIPQPAEQRAGQPEEPAEVVNLLGTDVADEREPLPIFQLEGLPVQHDGELVEGIFCKNGHFNHPDVRFCAGCGIGMAQQTHVRKMGIRPPVGYLVLDSGDTFMLDRDYVIGREPDSDPDVQAGRARPLRIDDSTRLVSRIHAVVTLDGWQVTVADRNSANGTAVQVTEDAESIRLVPGSPQPLQSGARVIIGRHSLLFASHHHR